MRNLTDADVEAIVDRLKDELVADFYGEVGKGVWAWIKRIVIGLLFLLAVYGVAHGGGTFGSIVAPSPAK